jgi:hypothetical protein
MAKKLQTSVPAPSMDRDYQSEDDHRMLMRAEEVRMDRRRFSGAMRHGKRQLKAMTRIMSGRR